MTKVSDTGAADHKSVAQDNFLQQAVDGFLESGKKACEKPAHTLASAGLALAGAEVLSWGVSLAEKRYGVVGTAAKIGLATIPSGAFIYQAVNSNDAGHQVGQLVFDLTFLTGLSKVVSAVSPAMGNIKPSSITADFNSRYAAMETDNLQHLSKQFGLRDAPIVQSKWTKVESNVDGTGFNAYENADVRTRLLLDPKMARNFEGAAYPYKGVDLGTYPLRGTGELYSLPNRDSVETMKFEFARKKNAAEVFAGSSDIHVYGHTRKAGEVFKHEYGHVVANRDLKYYRSYIRADALDNPQRISKYADTTVGESFAETLGNGLLNTGGDVFVKTVHTNPLRSFIANRYLKDELSSVLPEARSVHHDAYQARSRYIDEVTPNLVREMLEQSASKPGSAREAVRTIMTDVGRADPEAAKLIRSEKLEAYLNEGGAASVVWSKLHKPLDFSKISMGYAYSRLITPH